MKLQHSYTFTSFNNSNLDWPIKVQTSKTIWHHHDTCSKTNNNFVHFYKNDILFYCLLYFNLINLLLLYSGSYRRVWEISRKTMLFFGHNTCVCICFWRLWALELYRKLVVCRFPSSRPVGAEVCVESHMLRAGTAASLHGALQGNGWNRVRARAEATLKCVYLWEVAVSGVWGNKQAFVVWWKGSRCF